MSRSGYSDDYEGVNLWRGAVNRAIKGKRGQRMLRELLAALDAMPDKTLAADSLVTADGEYCTLGVLGAVRGLDLKSIDPEDSDAVARAFGVAPALVREVVYENDESEDGCHCVAGKWTYQAETPAERWIRMRKWVEKQIASAPSERQNGGPR